MFDDVQIVAVGMDQHQIEFIGGEPSEAAQYRAMAPDKLAAKLRDLEAQMYKHAENLEFEQAAQLRDEIERVREIGLGPGLATGT